MSFIKLLQNNYDLKEIEINFKKYFPDFSKELEIFFEHENILSLSTQEKDHFDYLVCTLKLIGGYEKELQRINDELVEEIKMVDIYKINRHLEKYGKEPIINHYEILEKQNIFVHHFMDVNDIECILFRLQAGYPFTCGLYSINSPVFAKFLIEGKTIHWKELSKNETDIAVKFLISHSEKICMKEFSKNKNNIACQYLLENKNKIDKKTVQLNENTDIVNYILSSGDITIDSNYFCHNENDIAVQFYIDNPEKINPKIFSGNRNSKAVNFLLQNKKFIDQQTFLTNENDLCVDYIVKENLIDEKIVKKNKNIKLKLIFLKNYFPEIFKNEKTEKEIMKTLLENKEKVGLFFLQNFHYDYLEEKIDFYNSLKLFPKSEFIISIKNKV